MMGQYILKLHDEKLNCDWYLIWSEVVDAPITYGISLEEFKEFYHQEYGEEGMRQLSKRLERVEQTGCSSADSRTTTKSMIAFNRAGPAESPLDMEGILQSYCRTPKREKL